MLDIITRTKNTFTGQRPGERVILVLRRHWYILASTIIAHSLLLLLPALVYIFARSYIARTGLTSLYALVVMIYVLIWWYSLAYAVTMYLLNVWVVTDHRIVTSEQHGFFNHIAAELSLGKVQNTSAAVTGVIATMFNFGDVEIETASEGGRFIFQKIPAAYSVKDIIMRSASEYTQQHQNNQEPHGLGSGGI